MTVVLAEAGLSECVPAGVCPEFGRGLATLVALWGLIAVLVVVWLIGAQVATMGVIEARTGVAWAVLWILAVWLLPLVGLIAWFVRSRLLGTASRRNPQGRSLSTGRPDSDGFPG